MKRLIVFISAALMLLACSKDDVSKMSDRQVINKLTESVWIHMKEVCHFLDDNTTEIRTENDSDWDYEEWKFQKDGLCRMTGDDGDYMSAYRYVNRKLYVDDMVYVIKVMTSDELVLEECDYDGENEYYIAYFRRK